jgi:hypothetical protein
MNALAIVVLTVVAVVDPGDRLYKDSVTGAVIPNSWFLDNGLPVRDPTVAFQDPDGDGFTNEDEWRGNTDPNNKDSHPPYYTKLFLARFVQIPFRWVLRAYDGDPQQGKPGTLSFQLDTIDLHQPSEFLKLGEMVSNTRFKLEGFQFKQALNPKTGLQEDVSELTLVNTDTGEKLALVYNRIVNSPEVFADFTYEWPKPVQRIRVKKSQEFVLKPEIDDAHQYKLLDVTDTEAVIQLPNGEKQTIKPHPPKRE